MENQGKIEAYDLYKHKVKLIEHNLKRLGVKNVHVQAGDSTKLIEHYPPETFEISKGVCVELLDGDVRICIDSACAVAVSEEIDRKSTRLNSSHSGESRMPSSA